MRTASLIASLSTALSLVSGCVVGEDGQIDDNTDNVIGGTTDNADPSVLFLRNVVQLDAYGRPYSIGGCTASVIAPQVLLTASHCFNSSALWTDVLGGTKPDLFQNIGANTVYGTVIQHPLYNGSGDNGHDVAVVLLSRPIGNTPLHRGVTPQAGATVRSVGYGASNFDQTGLGTKRELVSPVNSVTATLVNAGYEGHNLCHGDSGGPTFYNGGIVAVNDFVDTGDCHGGGHMGRVDINLDFIHLYAPSF